MSEANAETIHRLYVAMGQRDGEAMAACYSADASFQDPVFTLRGNDIGDMWRMLCARGKDLAVEVSAVRADAVQGSAHWVATYTFSKTNRPAVNRIDARFVFRDGLIVEHLDRFNLWRWSAQALGPVGILLGWTPLVRARVRKEAAQTLAKFSAERRQRMS